MTVDIDKFAAALAEVQTKHSHFTLEMPWPTLCTLLGQLQLALRHPGQPHYAGALTRQVIDDIISTVETVSPTLAECLRLGNDPVFDVPVPSVGRREPRYHALPRNFDELVNYLHLHPRLRVHHPREGISYRCFKAASNGHLVFDDGSHTPAGGPCGPGGMRPHLEFADDGFTVEMFDLAVRYVYLPD